MKSTSLTDSDKSGEVSCEKLLFKRSLPECLTARNISTSQMTTQGVVENTNNHDKVIAMELPAELPSLVEIGRTARAGRNAKPMRIDGNSFCGSQVQDLSKEASSDCEEIDFDDQNKTDRRYASCNLVRTKLATSLRAPKARSLNSTPFYELASGTGVIKSLSTQSVADSISSNRNITLSSTGTEGALRKTRDRRRIPPIQPTRKHLLMPLEHREAPRLMSIEGTQFATKVREKDQENSIDAGLQGNQERCEINKEGTNEILSSPRAGEIIENVTTADKLCDGRTSFKEPEPKISLPSITLSQPSDSRYKSRFRVKLLPLVTKSDSLPNLTDSLSSQPSGLLVTSSLGHSAPALDLEGISETTELGEETKEKKTEELHMDEVRSKKRARARSLSVDSAFSVSNLMFAKESREIAIDGNKMLPEIKAGPMAKKLSLPSLKGAKKAEKMWFTPSNNLPWR